MLSLLSRVLLGDPMDWSPPGSSVHGNPPDEHPEVGCHALLQGTFLTQGLSQVSPGLQVHSLPTESPEKPSPAIATITFQKVVSKEAQYPLQSPPREDQAVLSWSVPKELCDLSQVPTSPWPLKALPAVTPCSDSGWADYVMIILP